MKAFALLRREQVDKGAGVPYSQERQMVLLGTCFSGKKSASPSPDAGRSVFLKECPI